MRNVLFLLSVILFVSCGNDPVPKPKALLRLEYPNPNYLKVKTQLPFSFEKNELSKDIENIKVTNNQNSLGLEVTYPTLKGTIYLTYKKIYNSNLNSLLLDAQNITQTHTVKADEIIEQPFVSDEHKVYGMFYEVGGNAASQSQFYVTDSLNHFITGSLYFYAKPNYDSILPAADYLKKDIKHIMETIRWKED
ncbi:gliding motility lipoprotein GldD [Flavobacteriaceae bacterium AU392]|nr:gliding motility lipoprotein GldD [Flavobacteriaceae bacterium]RKM85044.1 gliding motility lipoprotein GldD [Flavobacteriaceae bacterium AU392]